MINVVSKFTVASLSIKPTSAEIAKSSAHKFVAISDFTAKEWSVTFHE